MNGAGAAVAVEYQEENLGQFHRQDSGYGTQPQSVVTGYNNSTNRNQHLQQQQHPAAYATHKEGGAGSARAVNSSSSSANLGEWMEMNVALLRHETGFGFRIVGGTEEGSQVSLNIIFSFIFLIF